MRILYSVAINATLHDSLNCIHFTFFYIPFCSFLLLCKIDFLNKDNFTLCKCEATFLKYLAKNMMFEIITDCFLQ